MSGLSYQNKVRANIAVYGWGGEKKIKYNLMYFCQSCVACVLRQQSSFNIA